ncbi:MAG TPA: hypothetical protein VJ521_12225, partial [Acidobacteriota bacterium]|nr:hypothetical protein [Acidobacteriota bacterium]
LTVSAVYYWMQLGSHRNALLWFLFFSGLAVLTRPEGLAFAPLVLFALYRSLRTNFRTAALIVAACIPWILFVFWSMIDSDDNYRDVMLQNLMTLRAEDLLTRVVAYLDVYPYISFYPVFALSIYGLLSKYSKSHGRWLTVLVYLHVCWFVTLTIHASWSTRFLLLPSSMLLLPAAAGFENLGIPQRASKVLFILLIVLLSAFSGIAFQLQRKTFADFKQVAECAATQSPKERILSDENIKTEYYLRRSVEVYTRAEPLTAGDILILHSFNTDLSQEMQYLQEKYEVEFLCMNESEVVPILANGVLEKNELTNSHMAVQARFNRQRFRSIALEIKKH